jgi:protein-S-isoprenylcysteine O-methyltransferase Ste14
MHLSPTPSETAPAILERPPYRIRTGARILLSRLFVAGVAASLLLGQSRWVVPGSIVPEVMMLIGLIMATMAMAGRMWCSLFIAGRKNAVLVTQGPYALCRNPLYLFSIIGALGVGLASGMFTVALAVGLVFALYYPAVIRSEETYLHQRHGESFTVYVRTVPCFWPRWCGGLDVFPESIQCHTRIFINHLASAIWFPIACGAIHVVSLLRCQVTVWPVWLVLP